MRYLILSLTLLTACDSCKKNSDAQNIDGTLEGYITYDSVPAVCDPNCRLNYNATEHKPVRNAVVQILSNDEPITETISDDNGYYHVEFTGPEKVQVMVLAQSETPSVVVADNTAGQSIFGMISGEIDITKTTSQDLHAASGWDGSQYATDRISAPFAILDKIYEAYLYALAESGPELEPLYVYWSEKNRPESGDKTQGQIGTSHWDPTNEALFILGAADADTDEFDAHVIIHEWSHYFAFYHVRSDTLGGQHSAGRIADMRLALHEGLGNAYSGLVLNKPLYVDTQNTSQQSGFSFNLENNLEGDTTPGWFSENSVQSIVYDLFDRASESWDTLQFSPAFLFSVLDQLSKNDTWSSIFSFIQSLQALDGSQNSQIATLLNKHNIQAIVDAYGSTETNNGGDSRNLPVYKTVTIGGSAVTVDIFSDTATADSFNLLLSNRYLRLIGNGQAIEVSAVCDAEDIIFWLQYFANDASADGATECTSAGVCTVGFSFSSKNNAVYMLNLIDSSSTTGWHSCAVSAQNTATASKPSHKSDAPVTIRSYWQNGRVLNDITFLTEAKDVVIRMHGAYGLILPETVTTFAQVNAQQTVTIPIDVPKTGTLVISTRALFNDRPISKVVTFDLASKIKLRGAQPSLKTIGKQQYRIFKAQTF